MFGRALGGWDVRRVVLATVVTVVVVLLIIAIDRSTALADLVVVAQEESPYQVDVTTVETPFWLKPWGPLTGLPVWAAAAVLAGAATAAILIVVGLGRWAWSAFSNRRLWS